MGGTAGRRHTARGSGARTYTSSMPAAKPTQKDDTSADARKPIARYFVFFFDSPSFFASSFEPAFEPDVEPDVEPDFEPDVEPVEVRGVRGLGGPARGVRGLGGPAWVKTMLEHCARRDRHSIGLTYADTLALVLNALPASAAEREDAYDVLREEVIAGFGLCFTGRLSRLVNALGGIVDGVGVHLSASEERANAIVRIRRRNAKALGLDTDEYLARTIADVQEMLGAEMDEYECDVWIDAL